MISKKRKRNIKSKKLLRGGGGFKNMRIALDSMNHWHVRRIRKKNRTANKQNHERFVVERDDTQGGDLEHNEYQGKTADSKCKSAQDRYIREFPNSIVGIKKYSGIDQGEEGACSFVGFLNLCLIAKKTSVLKSDVLKKWPAYWKKFGKNTSADIAETLDDMVRTVALKNTESIEYVPVRSEGNNENIWNQTYWVDSEEVIDYFSINKDIYLTCPWVYQNGYFVENLISYRKPLEINALQHSRTCVGFNKTQLLFADNWGTCEKGYSYEQKWTDGTDDHFIAGFSTVDKWAIYSHLRDLVYFK